VSQVHTGVPVPADEWAHPDRQRVALVDLLDRLLAGGVVVAGDVTISVAEVDLVRISLRAIIAAVRPEMDRALDGGGTR
jgi:Gas vesicle protein